MSFGAVAGVAGALISSSASGDAADSQAAASAATDATNRYIFDEQKKLQEPFRNVGVQANNRLAYLLGLDPGAANDPYGPSGPTYEQLRKEMEGQFTTKGAFDLVPIRDDSGGWIHDLMNRKDTIDEAGLNAAIRKRMAEYRAPQRADPNDPAYGSLMKKFGMEDFEADPGYEFRRTEGMRGVEGSAAARGNLLSGAAQKAIQKYGQGLASQEYGNAYSRYNADQTNQYNRLAGVVNTGQGATNQVSNAAGQYGAATASNNAALGNAQAAGAIGQANAWNQGIGTALGSYQNNELMKMIRNPGGGSWGNLNSQYFGNSGMAD